MKPVSPQRINEGGRERRRARHGQGYDEGFDGEGLGGKSGFEGLGEFEGEERVRQGSKARMVEVIDSPSLEGLEARLSGESPERTTKGGNSSTDVRDGGIILL